MRNVGGVPAGYRVANRLGRINQLNSSNCENVSAYAGVLSSDDDKRNRLQRTLECGTGRLLTTHQADRSHAVLCSTL
jgi:hypothetical protein